MPEPMSAERLKTMRVWARESGRVTLMAEELLDLVDEVDRLRAEAAKAETQMLELIDDRDHWEARVDKMVYAIAPVEVIGEWSSANDPFDNALHLVTPAAEVDRLTEREAALRELHSPFKIYDECSHLHHTPAEVEIGNAIEVEEIGLTCDDGFQYLICGYCCMDADGYHTEDCASGHKHGKDLPICPTTAILDGQVRAS